MSLAHWGTSRITGRGLVGLIGKGQIYQATLKPGESFVVHPSALLAYSITNYNRKPKPYRIAAVGTRLRLQIPNLVRSWWGELELVKAVRRSEVWQAVSRSVWAVRTWVRRTVWGDRVSFSHPNLQEMLAYDSQIGTCELIRTPLDVVVFAFRGTGNDSSSISNNPTSGSAHF